MLKTVSESSRTNRGGRLCFHANYLILFAITPLSEKLRDPVFFMRRRKEKAAPGRRPSKDQATGVAFTAARSNYENRDATTA
jgi:hypothetical protein